MNTSWTTCNSDDSVGWRCSISLSNLLKRHDCKILRFSQNIFAVQSYHKLFEVNNKKITRQIFTISKLAEYFNHIFAANNELLPARQFWFFVRLSSYVTTRKRMETQDRRSKFWWGLSKACSVSSLLSFKYCSQENSRGKELSLNVSSNATKMMSVSALLYSSLSRF